MKRLALFLCLMVMPFVLAFAAATPDFSGTWIRDVGRSDAMATNIDGKVTPISADLIVKHVGNNLQIESRWNFKAPTTTNYVLSGTENYSSDERGNAIIYLASWEQDKLIIDQLVKADTPFGRAEVKTRAEWSLSDGGGTLTITTMTGGSSRKQVYHR
jgi:hypothetical protein